MTHRFVPPLSRDQWFIYTSQLLWGVGFGLWQHLQPIYIKFLGADPAQVGSTLTLAGLVTIFVYIPMGVIADRWRRKPLIMSAWVMGTIATLLIALAPDWRWVIPGLALYLLSSFSRPAVAGHIAATDISDNPSRTFAFLSTGFSLGSILSPTLGGWIANTWGLRAVLFVATGVGVLSTLAMAQLSDAPASPPGPHHNQRLKQVITDRPFLWQMFTMFLIVFALEIGTVFAPNYLQEVKGLNYQQIGQLGTAASTGMFLFMLGLGYMRPERRRPLLLNQLVVMGGLALLLIAPGGMGLHPLLIAGYFLRGGSRAVIPLTRGRLSHWLPPDILGLGFGVMDTASQAAVMLAPLTAGLLYDRSPALPLQVGMLALGVTMLFTLTLPRTRRQRLAETTV